MMTTKRYWLQHFFLWRLERGEPVAVDYSPVGRDRSEKLHIRRVAFSPDGKYIMGDYQLDGLAGLMLFSVAVCPRHNVNSAAVMDLDGNVLELFREDAFWIREVVLAADGEHLIAVGKIIITSYSPRFMIHGTRVTHNTTGAGGSRWVGVRRVSLPDRERGAQRLAGARPARGLPGR